MAKLRTGRLILILTSTLILAVMIIAGAYWLRNNLRQNDLLSTAETLGYDPIFEIARVERCWDIFAHCGTFLYYQTSLTQPQLEDRIQTLGWELNERLEVTGSELFTGINFGTKSRLNLNGQEPSGNPLVTMHLTGIKWRLTDVSGVEWTISFFPVASWADSVSLNDQPLTHDVIAILRQTR